jgi:argininosuccinate synthase
MPASSSNKKPQIRSFADIESLDRASTCVCLYSGGLDGTYLLYRLSLLKFHEVVALRVGLGGDPLPEIAKDICHRLNVRLETVERQELFARNYVLPAIRAQARYLGGHPICASLSRPLLATAAVELAKEVNSPTCIIHSSDSSQNSLRRFNGALRGLEYPGPYGSPYDCGTISRAEKRAALERAGIKGFMERVYSGDSNLWGREFEAAGLDDPEQVMVPEELYQWTRTVTQPEPVTVTISFEAGAPTHLDRLSLDLVGLIRKLNSVAGTFGLGRFIGLEEISGGAKVQEVREMPAAELLLDAYRRLETACLPAETIRAKMDQEQLWVREAVEGRWYGVLREAAEAFVQTTALNVSGRISYSLSKLAAQPVSIISFKPLYIRDRDTIIGE